MDSVLEGAAVLCICKLVSSVLFLPSLAASRSPVSFCCCCLLVFTDFLVAVFLSFLTIFGQWLTELTPFNDIIALRFLLFLSHTYGAGLLLTTPLIAVDILIRVQWKHTGVAQRMVRRIEMDSERQRCYVKEVTAEEEEDSDSSDKETAISHIVSYLCCLSVWVIVALNVSWRWRLEEVWASVCLQTTNSLIRCLPNLFRPMPIGINPSWIFVPLSSGLLILAVRMHRQTRVPAWVTSAGQERTKTGIPPTFITGDRVHLQRGWREWGFPRPGANAIIGFMAVLFTFVMPLNLSVNILLISTIETVLGICIKSLAPSAANTSNKSTSYSVTLV